MLHTNGVKLHTFCSTIACTASLHGPAVASLSCRVKFGAFYEYLASQQEHNFDRIASGHYARIIRGEDPAEPVRLALAPDAIKDQTYFLAHLTQNQLSKVMFPLGHFNKVSISLSPAQTPAETNVKQVNVWCAQRRAACQLHLLRISCYNLSVNVRCKIPFQCTLSSYRAVALKKSRHSTLHRLSSWQSCQAYALLHMS